jgi:hypothetical protein
MDLVYTVVHSLVDEIIGTKHDEGIAGSRPSILSCAMYFHTLTDDFPCPYTIPESFQRFKIKPGNHRSAIRDRLCAPADNPKVPANDFQIEDDFLIGSYARSTMISPRGLVPKRQASILLALRQTRQANEHLDCRAALSGSHERAEAPFRLRDEQR